MCKECHDSGYISDYRNGARGRQVACPEGCQPPDFMTLFGRTSR